MPAPQASRALPTSWTMSRKKIAAMVLPASQAWLA
jgi:hypothetical protein